MKKKRAYIRPAFRCIKMTPHRILSGSQYSVNSYTDRGSQTYNSYTEEDDN